MSQDSSYWVKTARLTNGIDFYCKRVLAREGWNIKTTYVEVAALYTIEAVRILQLKESGFAPVKFNVEFILQFQHDGTAVLEHFSINAHEVPGHSSAHYVAFDQVLEPVVLLVYWGKRFTNSDDHPSSTSEELWTFRSARNFQALLDAYDELAQRSGCPALFTPMGKAN